MLYCIATVYKVGEQRSERTLAVGEHRLIYLKPKKNSKGLLASRTRASARASARSSGTSCSRAQARRTNGPTK